MSNKQLRPVGQYRTGSMRMFQAVAANRVRQNVTLDVPSETWTRQCLKPMKDAMLSSSAIIADDVAVAMEKEYGQDDLLAKLFFSVPCWRPPFDTTWLEMDLTTIPMDVLRRWAGGTEGRSQRRIEAVGAFYRVAESTDPGLIFADHAEHIAESCGPENTAWLVEYDLWVMINGVVIGPSASGTMFLGRDGQAAKGMKDHMIDGRENIKPFSREAVVAEFDLAGADKAKRKRILDRLISEIDLREETIDGLLAQSFGIAAIWLCGYALGLMHCKNIVTPVATDADRKADPRLPKSGVQYRVLKVRPMNQRRGSVSSDAGEPQPLSLHVVRGHFSDYRNGRGLFGKHRGLYWWSPHARGSAEFGETVKDYAPVAQELAHA